MGLSVEGGGAYMMCKSLYCQYYHCFTFQYQKSRWGIIRAFPSQKFSYRGYIRWGLYADKACVREMAGLSARGLIRVEAFRWRNAWKQNVSIHFRGSL